MFIMVSIVGKGKKFSSLVGRETSSIGHLVSGIGQRASGTESDRSGLAIYQLVGSDEFAHAPGLGDSASGGVGAVAVKYLRNAAQTGLLS